MIFTGDESADMRRNQTDESDGANKGNSRCSEQRHEKKGFPPHFFDR